MYAKIDDFIGKVIALKKELWVHHIFYVAYPPENEREFKDIKDKVFTKRGLTLEIQRFTGFHKDELYPKEDTGGKYDLDYGISDYEFYRQACSQKSEKKVLCKMNKLLFAPNGNIYNCHYRLYTNSPYYYGNLFDQDFRTNIPKDFFECEEFGFCNPCDFENLQIKPTT